jgi:hypothetical protein
MPNNTQPLPSILSVVDRCWCDFSAGHVFQPYNASQWEHSSVAKLKASLERQTIAEDGQEMERRKAGNITNWIPTVTPGISTVTPPSPTTQRTRRDLLWILRFMYGKTESGSSVPPPPPSEPTTAKPLESSAPRSGPQEGLSYIRREYDLRPYNLDVIIDFGWSQP